MQKSLISLGQSRGRGKHQKAKRQVIRKQKSSEKKEVFGGFSRGKITTIRKRQVESLTEEEGTLEKETGAANIIFSRP